MKIPLAVAALYLIFSVIGKGTVVTLNLKFGFPVAYFNIASYINCGKIPVTSYEVMFKKFATLNCLVALLAS
jgi:hypothetical protein